MDSEPTLLTLLPELAEFYKDLYPIPSGTLLHNTISLIISQQIKFSQGRLIRKKLYNLLNSLSSDSSQHDHILKGLTQQDWVKLGLPSNKIQCIIEVATIPNLTIESLINIKGIGPWTIKALKILMDSDPNVFLNEDLWIRKRMSELCNSKKVLTPFELTHISNKIPTTNLTQISRFLWRLKPEGVVNLLNGRELTRQDFI